MATPYMKVYGRFLSKIEDYPLLEQIEENPEFAKEMMHDYLISAISHFTYSIKDLSDRDDGNESFKLTLSDLEIEILALFMMYSYLSPYIVSTEKIRETFTSKDFNNFSPANLMGQVKKIQQTHYDRAVQLMVENHYRGGF